MREYLFLLTMKTNWNEEWDKNIWTIFMWSHNYKRSTIIHCDPWLSGEHFILHLLLIEYFNELWIPEIRLSRNLNSRLEIQRSQRTFAIGNSIPDVSSCELSPRIRIQNLPLLQLPLHATVASHSLLFPYCSQLHPVFVPSRLSLCLSLSLPFYKHLVEDKQ